MSAFGDALLRLGLEWRSIISQYPRVYAAWVGVRAPSIALGINKQRTDLVLEGYPRSGNTFAWHAFMMAQSMPFEVAHHSHIAARVIKAVRSGIPTLVLIREPRDCAISYCIYEPQLTVGMALVHWIRFYRAIQPYRHGYVLATFDQVVTDFGIVTSTVNERFGTQFGVFQHTDENVKLVFSRIESRLELINSRGHFAGSMEDRIGRPSHDRESKRQELENRLEQDRRLVSLVCRASELYSHMARDGTR